MELVALSKTCKLPVKINPSLNEILQPASVDCSSGSVFLSYCTSQESLPKGLVVKCSINPGLVFLIPLKEHAWSNSVND